MSQGLQLIGSEKDLRRKLGRIAGASYRSYKSLAGAYQFGDFVLHIDHVQGDPFAAPSRLRVVVPQRAALFPPECYQPGSRAVGVASLLARRFSREAKRRTERRGSGGSGRIGIDTPGQEVLERTAVEIGDEAVEARFTAGLPAAGRRVLAREAEEMLLDDIPAIVRDVLFYESNEPEQVQKSALTNEDADHLRAALSDAGLVAFVEEGALLPRRSGVDDRPLREGAVPFASPASLRCEIELPNRGTVRGMGIPPGVTLIVGGGFHGKSTLLNALERGVYNHRPGDGREYVVTDPTAAKIRAEDGRSVAGVDISPFIGELPQGRKTRCFSTENASGSTSQAANIVEALEVGTGLLLIDEDTTATNFMIRDHRMQELIAGDKEPITPFVDKVQQLYKERGVSTIIVAGGSGDYFDVADTVIALENYVPVDVTAKARAIAEKYKNERKPEGGDRFGPATRRAPDPRSLDARKGKREWSVHVRGRHTIQFGEGTIDLSAISQIVDASQTRAIAAAIVYGSKKHMDGRLSFHDILERILADVERDGLLVLARGPVGDLARFRPLELAAAINRLRSLRVTPERERS